jgi:hypothetical protein
MSCGDIQKHSPLAETVSEGYFIDAPFGESARYPPAVGSVHDLHALGFLQHGMRYRNARQRASYFQLIVILSENT